MVLLSVSLMLRLIMKDSGFLWCFPQVLTDSVEDDDRIVQRIADDGQKRCNNRQGKFLFED